MSALMPALRALLAKAAAWWVPPARLVVSSWLDEHRVIGKGYPSPFPGPWRSARTPYLIEPMDAFNDPNVETLVLMFSSQIGKTELLLGTMLYAYGQDPGPGMCVLPTLELAGGFSSDRIASALQTCKVLRVGAPKQRTAEDAVFHKRINGAALTNAGAQSPASLSSRPVRYLWCDEIDRWPATTPEGDPLSLAKQRTAAYRRRKLVLASTPTTKGASRIEDWYQRSDMRVYELRCPGCDAYWRPMWAHVRWEGEDTSGAHLECPHCGHAILEQDRMDAVARGRWTPTRHGGDRIRGYHTWAIVSPWVRMQELVDSFLEAKKKKETLKAWINLTLGESWEEDTIKVEGSTLLARREAYAEEVPTGAAILTVGVDTQDDRLELLVVGWGVGEEAWVIERETIMGDPVNASVWKELDTLYLQRAWPVVGGGHAYVQCALVDCLGHRTAAVYNAVRERQARRVYASVGKSGGASGQLVSAPKVVETSQGNIARVVVDADQVKSLIYSRLRTEQVAGDPQADTVHFPMTVGESFFDELTSEHLITEHNRLGVPSKKWAKLPGRTRNEALDCFGMAYAALRIVAPNTARLDDLIAKCLATRGAPAPGTKGGAPARRRTQGWQPS